MNQRFGRWGGLRLGFGASRVPVMLQTEGAECGLACLAMVAAAYGHDCDLPTLRRRFALSLKGVSLLDLVRMAEGLKLHARALRAEVDDLAQLQQPCILHWDMNHFVVLVGVKRGVATIHDPAHGLRRLKLEQVSRHFTGVVLELTPAADFEPRIEKQHVSPRQMLGRITGLKRSLAQIFVLALALEAFMLLSPFFMQWVVDDVLVSGDRDLLLTLGVGFALLVLIQVLTSAGRAWAVLVLSATLNLQWLLNVFGHLLRLPVAWFEKRGVGDIWSRFMAVQQIQKALTTSFAEAVLDGLLVAVTLVMMAVYSPLLSAIALAGVGLYALLRLAFFRPLREATEEVGLPAERATTWFSARFHRHRQRKSAFIKTLMTDTTFYSSQRQRNFIRH